MSARAVRSYICSSGGAERQRALWSTCGLQGEKRIPIADLSFMEHGQAPVSCPSAKARSSSAVEQRNALKPEGNQMPVR